jgi:hypothetical protein
MADNTFDFGSVTVSEADMPKTAAGRNRKHEFNPFTEPLAASFEAFGKGESAGRQVTLPGAAVGEAVYLIRQAATDLGIGARVILRNTKGETIDNETAKKSRGNVTVLFSGKNRKQSKKDAAEGAAEAQGTEGAEDASEDA